MNGTGTLNHGHPDLGKRLAQTFLFPTRPFPGTLHPAPSRSPHACGQRNASHDAS